jgi:hypothetical protein
VALDTGPFLLDVIGSIDPQLVSRVKRTCMFGERQYYWLRVLCVQFQECWITAGIVTEACNHLDGENKTRHGVVFEQIRTKLLKLQESVITSSELAQSGAFLRFGLADCSLIELAGSGCLVVTSEAPLTHYLETQKLPVLNINHIRE